MKNGEAAYIWKSSPQKWELIPDEYKTFVEMDAKKYNDDKKPRWRLPSTLSFKDSELLVLYIRLFCRTSDLNIHWNPEDIQWYLAHLTAEMLLYY